MATALNVARWDFKGETVRILFHKVPITGSQTSLPAGGVGSVARQGGGAHAVGKNMITQTRVERLVKGSSSGIRAYVSVDAKQVKGFSADRVIKLANESVTGDQDGR